MSLRGNSVFDGKSTYLFPQKEKNSRKKSTDNLSFCDKIEEFRMTIEEKRDRF
jgi:hypothetical protein